MEQIIVLHVSDVHIESNLFNRQFGLIAGWRGHDVTLCRGLQEAFELLPYWTGLAAAGKETAGVPPLYVLLSGDLTCYGRESDFATAHSFFRCKRPVDLDHPVYELGLGLGKTYQYLAIPGNHDHWNGLRFPARPYNPGIFPSDFRTTPWSVTCSSTSGKFQLQLFGVDSNSGLHPLAGQPDAILARGKVL
ncbi:MAG TPA: metallophosphoesterase [Tepidisphaeraceae bacterium]|jgi:3',5'-cyclic AMP phosphodiesterase CpdA